MGGPRAKGAGSFGGGGSAAAAAAAATGGGGSAATVTTTIAGAGEKRGLTCFPFVVDAEGRMHIYVHVLENLW
ncbi:hypothetical protein M0802_007474 [Mischocyttarus mexicanus]|nr:hypothetical protein M0802_007474 [Mischocyttarus mexicanus]